jgi:F-type H+-transporting ATPase subunit epsilon
MTFHLEIVTPDGVSFDGQAESLYVRTQQGDIGILPNHIDYLAALGMGQARVTVDGQTRTAACIGGMVSVSAGEVKLVATTFEWAEDIDVPRAKAAEARARRAIDGNKLTEEELRLAEARLKRALVRQSVGRR